MKKLTWWFRIVGLFYLLLTLMNLWALFFGGDQMFADTLRPPLNAEPLAIRSFMDAWMVFVFELGVLGAMALVASRQVTQSRILAWTIIWAEVFRGIVADAIWIMQGYAATSYAVFIVIHLAIIVTGILFLRQSKAEVANL